LGANGIIPFLWANLEEMVGELGRILEWHRARSRPLSDELVSRATSMPPCRGFAKALSGEGLAVIAEIKRRSPSAGDIWPDLDPADVAVSYERGGAKCLSVLTDSEFFGGSPGDLLAARSAVGLPVLRKDFVVSEIDIYESRAMGADCVLLIVAAIAPEELRHYLSLAAELGMDALVEVHEPGEVEVALDAGASLIGVNQRDLRSFRVEESWAAKLASELPDGVLKVAESGIRGPKQARELAEAGYDAILVGESLLKSEDPQRAVARLCEVGQGVSG